MTGDSRPPVPEGGWHYAIGTFESYYSGWKISADSVWYFAQRKTAAGPRGPRLKARTLDVLAVLIDAAD